MNKKKENMSGARFIFLLMIMQWGHFAVKAVPFKPASVLQSNMVIQQAKPFRLWGTADAGDKVTVYADWTSRPLEMRASDRGAWSGEIPVPAAVKGNFDPHTITIIHRQDTLKLENILIGEVWLCAGQSNMDMVVGKIEGWYPGISNYEQEAAAADYPAIRLLKIAPGFQLQPQLTSGGTWQVCTPKTVWGFSAVAYFFGRELFNNLKVPVGLIAAAIAGASCQAFTPMEVLESDPLLKKQYLDPYRKDLSSQQVIDSTNFFRKVTCPTLVYNAIIHPLEGLSLRGCIWYQGESNHMERSSYTHLCTAMLESWRQRFHDKNMPFYFTQIAPYKTEFDKTGNVSAFFREAQEALLQVKHTGMAVTMDVGEWDNVHPREKKSVGLRLAKSALHQTYHFNNIAFEGPRFASMQTAGDRVKVSFVPSGVSAGLRTRDGKAPQHFQLAGSDQAFRPAQARIVGKQVWLHAEGVKRPVAVRYAFTNGAITNLENKEGLPVVPFRTDRWEPVSQDTTRLSFTVEEAPEWTALFKRTSGWFGADGIFALPVNGVDSAGAADSTLLIFSDTMIGDIVDGKLQPGPVMINNTVAYLKGYQPEATKIRFYWDSTAERKPLAIFVPNTPSAQKNDYYWLGDGFVNREKNNATYIFAYRMRNVSEKEWDFAEMGSTLIVIPAGSKPPFREQRQIETPLFFNGPGADDKGTFGAGILVNTESAGVPNADGYVYVYGVKGKAKRMVVARVLPQDIEHFSKWRFWDGRKWNADMRRSAYVANNVSNELSVTPLPDGRYALVFQESGMGPVIGLRLGLSPHGPFGPMIKLWECKEVQQKNFIVYNAKAHPALSRSGELLISYNVNAFNFTNELKEHPNLYRPRFIRLLLK